MLKRLCPASDRSCGQELDCSIWSDGRSRTGPDQAGAYPATTRMPLTSDTDLAHIEHAIELAEARPGRATPNPNVGAVVVRDGEIVGVGAHERFGGPHAEVMALAEAGDDARGATLYVSLEPCAHQGKTPPCTDAIVAAGISRVVVAA